MAELTRRPDAFVRPTPTSGTLGGVARRTREAMLLCEAARFDVVLVETVGTGQSEVAVEAMVDCFLVLVGPGSGDELQGIKRGIIELADLVAVTKADGELLGAAKSTAAEYEAALRLLRPKHTEWTPTVVTCSAHTGTGIDELWSAIESYRETLGPSGALTRRRAEQARDWMWGEIQAGLVDRVHADPEIATLVTQLEAEAVAGRIPPPVAADRVLEAFLGETPQAE
jgi:LAO/AO transport system kinase